MANKLDRRISDTKLPSQLPFRPPPVVPKTADGTADTFFLAATIVPTGTGFRHVTAGVEDAAAKLVDTADINDLQVTSIKIANDAVTYAKIRDFTAASRLLGRGSAAGGGDPEEITIGDGLRMNGTKLGVWPNASDLTLVGDQIEVAAFTGDVTKASGGTALTISNDAVSLAKMANMNTDRLLGRDTAGVGDPEEISLGVSLEFSGAASIQRAALTGDVTAPANSNATTIANNAATNAKIADMAAGTVKGRVFGGGAGDPTDNAVGTGLDLSTLDGLYIPASGIDTVKIAADAVDNTKIRNSGALSVIGRSANSPGDPADISASAASGQVLRESGSVLGFGQVATAGIADDAISNAKLANMAFGKFKARYTAGSGDPEDVDPPIYITSTWTQNTALAAGTRTDGSEGTGGDDAQFKVPTGKTCYVLGVYVSAKTGATAGTYTVKGGIKDVDAGTYADLASATAAASTRINPEANGSLASPLATYAAGKRLKLSILNNGTSPGALAAQAHVIRVSYALI